MLAKVPFPRPDVTLELLCSDLNGDLNVSESLLDDLSLEVFSHTTLSAFPVLTKLFEMQDIFLDIHFYIERKGRDFDLISLPSHRSWFGLGETDEEITEAMRLLREADVDLITIGQYLAPSSSTTPW